MQWVIECTLEASIYMFLENITGTFQNYCFQVYVSSPMHVNKMFYTNNSQYLRNEKTGFVLRLHLCRI